MRLYVNYYGLCEDCQLTLQHPEGGFVLVTDMICAPCLIEIRKQAERALLLAGRSVSRPRHTGSHPITETTCDDPECWCQEVRGA